MPTDWDAERPSRKVSKPVRTAAPATCAAPGCQNIGGLSAWTGQGSDGLAHLWYCREHFFAPSAPARAVARIVPSKSREQQLREDLEHELRLQCEAAIGRQPPADLWAAWWRERFTAYGSRFASRQAQGLGMAGGERARVGAVAEGDGQRLRDDSAVADDLSDVPF